MVSMKANTVNFLGNKETVALFVSDLIRTSHGNLPSITIMERGSLGVYCALTVTDIESVDILKQRVLEYSGLSLSTWKDLKLGW